MKTRSRSFLYARKCNASGTLLLLAIFIIAGCASVETQNKAGHTAQLLRNGCVLTANIKSTQTEGEFKIFIKDFSDITDNPKEIAKAIFIKASAYGLLIPAEIDMESRKVNINYEGKSSKSNGIAVLSQDKKQLFAYFLTPNVPDKAIECSGDAILYIEYKNKKKVPDLYWWAPSIRRIRRLSKEIMDQDTFLYGFNFTYSALLNYAEKLVTDDEITIAGNTVSVKARSFENLGPGIFTVSNLQK